MILGAEGETRLLCTAERFDAKKLKRWLFRLSMAKRSRSFKMLSRKDLASKSLLNFDCEVFRQAWSEVGPSSEGLSSVGRKTRSCGWGI